MSNSKPVLMVVSKDFRNPLLMSGFQCFNNFEGKCSCSSCGVGYRSRTYGLYRNSSSVSGQMCQRCPAGNYLHVARQLRIIWHWYNFVSGCIGGFFQDVVGQDFCTLCRDGTYVPPWQLGKSAFNCQVCPKGTDTLQHAGYRACHCLENHYRLDRFGPCQSCDRQEAKCQNDFKTLKPGFWWNMSKSVQRMYVQFTTNLLIRNDSYDKKHVNFTEEMPTIHKCRLPKACPGQDGDASKPVCANGSTGPLCELCYEGYFLTSDGCRKCQPRWRAALQLVVLITAVLGLFVFLSWKQASAHYQQRQTDTNSTINSKENNDLEKSNTWLDNCIAYIRIGIGFLQVMNGIRAALAFVPWPLAMVSITTRLQFIEFNIIDVATPQCFNRHLNHLWKTIIYFLCVTASLFVIAALYRMWVLCTRKQCRRETTSQHRAVAIRFCLTASVWILYACYPSLSQYIIGTIPYPSISCIPLNCYNTSDGSKCDWYLKADLSVHCHSFSQYKWRICQILLFLPIFLPLFLLFLLYMKRRDTNRQHVSRGPFVTAVYDSITFLHSNYDEKFWFWEVVEMARKLILTSGLLFFTNDSSTELAIASILANLFAVLHAQFHPIRQSLQWQHALQLISLSVISVNIMLGVLKIVAADSGHLVSDNGNHNSGAHETVFGILFYVVNGAFFIILLGA